MNTVPKNGKDIVCVHLYDDFSGAANVFEQALSILQADGHRLQVIVGSGGQPGFIRTHHPARTIRYRMASTKLGLLCNFLLAQVLLFVRVLRLCLTRRVDIVYVNTVLPAGAALAGKLCGKTVVFHLHEVGLGSASLFRLLLGIARRCGDRLISVSSYLATTLRLPAGKTDVVPNSLSPAHWSEAQAARAAPNGHDKPFVVVMACSLRWYKGLDSFAELAQRFDSRPPGARPVRFELLLNAQQDEFDEYVQSRRWPRHLAMIRRPTSIFDHYRHAGLVVNLSHPEGWIETFGLTLLEAMACGVPVICPQVGGCLELFEPGAGGWRIDSRDIDALEQKVVELAADPVNWSDASSQARHSAQQFAPSSFSTRLLRIFSPDQ